MCLRFLPSLLTAFAAFIPPASAQQPVYRAEFLGSVLGVARMNAGGEIVGTDTSAFGGVRGWVASSGSPAVALPLPPGRLTSWAHDINDLGVIVGAVSSSSFSPEFGGIAAKWVPNGSGGYTVVEFGKLSGHVRSDALGVNDAGDVIGFSADSQFRYPVLFTGLSGIQNLTATGLFDPQKINEQRVLVDVTGKRMDLDTLVVENLGLPAGSYLATNCYSINELGQVSGAAILSTGTSCVQVAARYTDVVGWETYGGCGPSNGVADLNDLGDMLLRLGLDPYVRFEGLGAFRIEDLIAAPVGHWFVQKFGMGINDTQQIAICALNQVTGENGLVLLTRETPVGTTLCYGDGSSGNCPCGNAGVAGAGCKNSTGVGAKLAATGSASVVADDLVLSVTQAAPGKSALFFQGVGSIAVPFQDGILCAGGSIKRLEAVTLDANGSAQSGVSIVGAGAITPGVTRTYQTWFRDPQGPCGTASNLSSAVQVTWQ
ncbi:MAG: hypothetical protein K8S98_07465 [Planctomycetes bacterium]|nr:hypothetical protein [Planctomycetota bacterium]